MVEKIYPLKLILKVYENDKDSKEIFLESLSNFKCKNSNQEVENFLIKNAIDFEIKNLSRTYIVYDKNPFDIIAYFSIAIKSIDLFDTSKQIRKKVSLDKNALSAPAYLLGQIGQTESCFLKKYELLDIALDYIKTAQNIVGGRSVYLDCDKNNEKLFNYYFEKGFRLMAEKGEYMQMLLKL